MSSPWEVSGIEVVALVASAGGLDALSAVLRDLPVDLPVAVIVQQHLSSRGSLLPHLLEKRTRHLVGWAVDGARLAPGRVSVCPARQQLEVLPDGTCSLRSLGPLPQRPRPRPHDILLTSLADSFGSRAVAVVLSGSGSDAAAGVAALKARGGLVIAQSQESAEYPAMPRAAADAGADLVLPLHEIAGVLADIASGMPVLRQGSEHDAISATFGESGQVAAAAASGRLGVDAVRPGAHLAGVPACGGAPDDGGAGADDDFVGSRRADVGERRGGPAPAS